MVTARGDRGLLAVLGSDGRTAAGAVRVVATPPDGRAAPVPGVEVSGFAAEHLVDEVLRLVPPDGVTVPLADDQPTEVSVPEHLAITLSRALQSGDEALAADVARECGHDDVPDLLRAASEQVRASATVTLAVAGSTRVEVHTWLQCRVGWLDLRVEGGTCTTRLVDRERIRLDLTHALAGALDALLGRSPMGDDLEVSGGAGGLTAKFDDMRTFAGLVDDSADAVRDAGLATTAVTASADLAQAAILCPVEVAEVEAALAAAGIGPSGALVTSTGMEVTARLVRGSVTAYQFTDDQLAALADLGWDAAGFTLGFVGVPLAVGGVSALAIPTRSCSPPSRPPATCTATSCWPTRRRRCGTTRGWRSR